MAPIDTARPRGRLIAAALGLALLPASARAEDRAGPMEQHRGGTLKLVARGSAGTIDPQINYTVQFGQLLWATNDGLLTFRKVGGEASNQVVADLAEAIPKPEDGGRTLRFRLRRGVSFSTGREVMPSDVVASFQRLFKVSSPTAGTFYDGIVGADLCLKSPADCTLKGGVEGDDEARTVTIRLREPDPDILYKLAFTHASILPADTPAHDVGTQPAAATGPYMVESYNPDRSMRLVRNPHFKEWSAEAQPDGYVDAMDYNFGLDDQAETTAVENGQADWMLENPPPDRLGEIGSRFAAQVHLSPLLLYYYLAMNVNEKPFDDLRVRQAVNFALDRKALVALAGGPNLAAPICQFLPAGLPSHADYCPYTLNPGEKWTAPDLAKARSLVDASGTKGQQVTLVVPDKAVAKAVGTYVQGVLRDLGYDAAVKVLSYNIQYTFIQNTKNHVQISYTGWSADYPAPSDFLGVLFNCSAFHPGSDSSANISGFCVPEIDAQMKRASTEALTDAAASDRTWAAVDRAVTDAAPGANMFQPKKVDFVSKRVGNFMFSNQAQFLLQQAWVR